MEIAILGFGAVAKEVIRQLKELPLYGKSIRVYCVHVRRNSLSYGPDTVIEIVDKFGDGLRVYKDGYEATDLRTTISSFEDWLIDEANTYDKVIDCTSYNPDSVRLLFRVLNNAKKDTTFFLPSKELVQNHWEEIIGIAKDRELNISFNSIPSGDPSQYDQIDLNRDTFPNFVDLENQDLFIYRHGGHIETAKKIVDEIKLISERHEKRSIDWAQVDRDEEWFKSSAAASIEAAEKMRIRLLERRIESQIADYTYSGPRVTMGTLDPEDIEVLERFIINNEGNFNKDSYYDQGQGRLVVKHEMLDWFFAWHKMIEVTANILSAPYLVPSGIRYIKYDRSDSYVSEYTTGDPCVATIIYAITQGDPWEIDIDGQSISIGVGQALVFYSNAVTQGRKPMGNSGNDYTEYLEIHFTESSDGRPSGICTCFDEKKKDI
jgi:hypothetical protein